MPSETPLAFFSYARADSPFALQLAKELKASGASVWLDQLDIRPGQRWDKAVEDALANSSRMLVILSPSSIDSTNVMDEVSFALEERKIVIPVLHQECKIPFRLRRVQYIDFRVDYAAGVRVPLNIMGVEEKAEVAPAVQTMAEVAASVGAVEDRPWAGVKLESGEPARGRELEVSVKQESAPGGRCAVRGKGTQARREPEDLYADAMWFARKVSIAVAALGLISLFSLFSLFHFFSSHDDTRKQYAYMVAVSLAQLAAWKWEWQGGAAAIAVWLMAAIFGAFSDGFEMTIYAIALIPAILFLFHWALNRKLVD